MGRTRAEIKRDVRILGRELFGGDASRDPFGLDILVKEVVNDVARRTDCYVGRRILATGVDTVEYCAPDVYRILNVYWRNPVSLEYKRLPISWHYERANDHWRNEASSTEIRRVSVFGTNVVAVYPPVASGYTSGDGLMIEGYAIPGDYWVYDSLGRAQEPTEADPCPLPDWAQDCVVYGVLAMRAKQMRDRDGIAIWEGEYLKRLGDVEAFAATYARRSTN